MFFSTSTRIGLTACMAALGCAAGEKPGSVHPGGGAPPSPPASAQATLAAHTAREAELEGELRAHVGTLASEIGERNLKKLWNYASATDGLAAALEGYGYGVRRLGYSVGDDVVQNLEVEVSGGNHGREVVVVGAHYDTHPGTPGADDNASGVAAVLCLAKAFRGNKPDRTLRFVLFANEEHPHFQTATMGSLVYAKELAARREEVVAMLSLESIGYFSEAPNSQKYPEEVAKRYPSIGNFIAIVSNPGSSDLLGRVAATMRDHATLPVVADVLAENVPGVAWSDHWAFWQLGFPALMVTDTAPFRNPNYHKPTDVPASLDYGRMARVVRALEGVVESLTTASAPAAGSDATTTSR